MNKNEILRDAYLEINLKTLSDNIKNIKNFISKDTLLMIVIKANGYGHGLQELVPTLTENKIDYLGVATLSEALKVREINKEIPILILGYTPPRLFEYIVDNNISQTIFSLDDAIKLNDISQKREHTTKIHIKIDTGLHRLGLLPTEHSVNLIKSISNLNHLNIEGIFSHLALLNENENLKQVNKFNEFISQLETHNIHIPLKHICDSIATIDFPNFHLNMVRVGALVYGMKGFHIGQIEVNPIMKLVSKVVAVHKIEKGEGVSYDYTWRASQNSIIGTIPLGYADGIPRSLSNKGWVKVKNTEKSYKAPIVGLINMDQMMVDLSPIPNIEIDYPNYEVIIYDDNDEYTMSINDVSKLSSTNKNDILSRLSTRIPRIYIADKTD